MSFNPDVMSVNDWSISFVLTLIFAKASAAILLESFASFTFSTIPLIEEFICLALSLVDSASFLISSATTPNPFPASPA